MKCAEEFLAPDLNQRTLSQLEQTGELISRLFLSFPISNLQERGPIFNELIFWIKKANQGSNQHNDRFSGFIIQRDNLIIVFLESSNNSLISFLRKIREVIQSKSIEQQCNVLNFSDLSDRRIYKFFFEEKMNKATDISFIDRTRTETEEGVWVVLKKILSAGGTVKKRLDKEDSYTPSILKETLNHLQFNNDDLSFLVNDYFPTVNEYLEMIENYGNIGLESQENLPLEPYLSELIEFKEKPISRYNGYEL